VNLGSGAPPELEKVRPAIVVSNTLHNERLDSVVVVPLSTRPPEIWPLRLRVSLRGMKTSYAVIPGIRQVSKARLHEPIGQLPANIMASIGEALTLYLGD
jgi:mRNA-degrading endonuclease toxin of MazEF toxin-antitoxin module